MRNKLSALCRVLAEAKTLQHTWSFLHTEIGEIGRGDWST